MASWLTFKYLLPVHVGVLLRNEHVSRSQLCEWLDDVEEVLKGV